jgi:cysteinyl-tRNA synthetase
MKHYLEFVSKARNMGGEEARGALEFLRKMDGIFDILPRNTGAGVEEELISLLLDIRARMRKEKKYDIADFIRDRLAELGIKIEDTKDGAKWYRI